MDMDTQYQTHDRFSEMTNIEVHGEHHEPKLVSVPVKETARVIDVDGGWYHDAAIKDGRDARAHPYR